LNHLALLVRSTPASVNMKPVFVPSKAPAKAALCALICATIVSRETAPVVPSVMMWNHTGTVAWKPGPPWPLALSGTSSAVSLSAGSRTIPRASRIEVALAAPAGAAGAHAASGAAGASAAGAVNPATATAGRRATTASR
jgi:hypothetical protein